MHVHGITITYIRIRMHIYNYIYKLYQARSKKLSLGGSFGQNVDLLGKLVDLFYKTVDILNKIEDKFSKIMVF